MGLLRGGRIHCSRDSLPQDRCRLKLLLDKSMPMMSHSLMHLGALSVLAIPLLLTPLATGAPQEHPATAAYHEDCRATPLIVYSAKTKQTVETYTADCTIKYIVPGKETRLVWGGSLVLPTNAS